MEMDIKEEREFQLQTIKNVQTVQTHGCTRVGSNANHFLVVNNNVPNIKELMEYDRASIYSRWILSPSLVMEEDDGKREMDKLEILGNHTDVDASNLLESQRFGIMAGMNRHAESSRQAETRPTHTSENGFLGAETNAINYTNSNIASSSRTREYIRQGSRHNFSNLARIGRSSLCARSSSCAGFQEGEKTSTSSQKDLSSMPLDPANGKAWWAHQDPNEQPFDRLMDGHIKNESLDNLSLRDKRLKVSSSANFSNFAVMQSTRGMGILCKSAGISNEYSAAEQKDLNSRMTCDVSLDINGRTVDLPKESANKGMRELYSEGMSLRKWLKHSFVEVNKAERLQIYRQVVQAVDSGTLSRKCLAWFMAFKFILLPSKEIIYSDSSTKHEVITTTESYSVAVELEKNWYACPEELYGRDLLSANVYSLGILLFEDILQSELLSGTKELHFKSNRSSIVDKNEMPTSFEACGTLKMGNLLNSANVICSLSFDRDENYIAAAGVSKKIKIFEFVSLLQDSVDVNYPAYLKNYLASADYDGVVQRTPTRAWCVDFSHVDPTQFASGSDDCSVKLWSLNEFLDAYYFLQVGSTDPISGEENGDGNAQFVSSVCWREKSNMIVAANSGGSIKSVPQELPSVLVINNYAEMTHEEFSQPMTIFNYDNNGG
ncbi:hypothetical protein OSB04_010671 [Centaurea solstitialis]|uniref:Protein SPA1-RELATED 2 n=1 Tax=Centaurea solstitialis TaxID=347529 RepID=A0AA38WC70_9ASTR|nr:hypothetical protein OSB04_010671 [Centaurea solstitialis]